MTESVLVSSFVGKHRLFEPVREHFGAVHLDNERYGSDFLVTTKLLHPRGLPNQAFDSLACFLAYLASSFEWKEEMYKRYLFAGSADTVFHDRISI